MSSFLTSLFSWLRPSSSRRPSSVRARLALELLEGRSLPSTVTLAASVLEHHGSAEAHMQHHHHHRRHHDSVQGGVVLRQVQVTTSPSGLGATGSSTTNHSVGQQPLQQSDSTTATGTSGGAYYGSGGGEGGGHHGDNGGRHGDGGDDPQGAKNQLEANLTGANGATGTAEFDLTANTFEVKVDKAAANATLNVVVDGNTVGTITTDSQGTGELELSQPGFTPHDGSTITVGDVTNGGLSGTFASNAEAEAELKADLTPPAGGNASGTGELKQNDQRLEVKVRDLAANATFAVTVDQTVVGQLTTDHNGRGELRLDNVTVAIKDGSVLTVGDVAQPVLQGTFTSSGGD
jgi:hypothetical protein